MTTTKRQAQSNGTAPEFDYGYLNVEGKTARFDLPWISPDAYLEVRPVGMDGGENPAYQEAMVARSSNRQRIASVSEKWITEQQRQQIEDDRDLYPRYVIVGWGGIKDRRGREVRFSVEACTAWMRALPLWIFRRLRVFCMRPESFVADAPEPLPEPAELAGNS